MHLDSHTVLQELEPAECLRLINTQHVGRVAFEDVDGPVVLPVHFALVQRLVVVRTAAGSWFDRAIRSRRVAFEVDSLDPGYHAGWSVMGRGRARGLEEYMATGHLPELDLRPWALTDPPGWVGIDLDELSGRRIVQILT
ncbi:MAG: pyridoxamine 5'-phosphate oxidase family protein [Ilumatobacteraceae bacterium]|nr:MAG: pyridoxamine 5'-phosphate oxidase family protein [Actinomycetota bacterium]